MLLWELGRIGRMSQFHMGEAVYPYALLAPFVLSAAVSIALTALMGWHFFLIWQGQVILLCCNSMQTDAVTLSSWVQHSKLKASYP